MIYRLTDRHAQRQTHTDRHIHADENNTCPKTKFLGKLMIGTIIRIFVVVIIRLRVKAASIKLLTTVFTRVLVWIPGMAL